eukprot:TRINITY_DN43369_c0_g1_i1.p1 TRINITY_DN43369_c0_g1~~TRINITY_DN43369_c0_g1_i1.p1  ORF type:complete len:569 (+),score=63.47 TRINITY_DN43369_c0_g1_i1:90-1796(+)
MLPVTVMHTTVFLLFGAFGHAKTSTAADGQRPHIIFMLGDDVGWSNVGWNNPNVKTPVLNSLRKSGVDLQRHYVYKFCSPSRSSLLSGRLAIHVNQENSATEQRYAGVPLGMTLFPELLQQVGYATHQLGKWHVGMASKRHIPTGRGFNSSIGYFNFGEDHYTQRRGGEALAASVGLDAVSGSGNRNSDSPCGQSRSAVDLWRNDHPAYGENGTYGGYIYRNESLRLIEAHDLNTPLFLFIAWQNLHAPLQVPQEYVDRYTGDARTTINGMSSFLDESIGLVVKALRNRGMWKNTLLVFCADNGGMLGTGGDNSPLRGGKFSDFEGGVRVASFVAGGALPTKVRGKSLDGIISVADWYTTLCAAAGGPSCEQDVEAQANGLPPLDSVNMWDYLTGKVDSSPRTELALSVLPAAAVAPSAALLETFEGRNRYDVRYYGGGEAIISGNFKLIQGLVFFGPFKPPKVPGNCLEMQGPWTTSHPGVPCQFAAPALYDVVNDPTETTDISGMHPEVATALAARIETLRGGVYAPDRGPLEQAACDAADGYGDFWGPWLNLGAGSSGSTIEMLV